MKINTLCAYEFSSNSLCGLTVKDYTSLKRILIQINQQSAFG